MPEKPDLRRTLTLKSEAFTPEFRALLNKAAKRAGKTQADWIAETLEREARLALTAGGQDRPDSAPPPALIARIEATDEKLDALAAQVQLLTERQQRSLWSRLFGSRAH